MALGMVLRGRQLAQALASCRLGAQAAEGGQRGPHELALPAQSAALAAGTQQAHQAAAAAAVAAGVCGRGVAQLARAPEALHRCAAKHRGVWRWVQGGCQLQHRGGAGEAISCTKGLRNRAARVMGGCGCGPSAHPCCTAAAAGSVRSQGVQLPGGLAKQQVVKQAGCSLACGGQRMEGQLQQRRGTSIGVGQQPVSSGRMPPHQRRQALERRLLGSAEGRGIQGVHQQGGQDCEQGVGETTPVSQG